MTVRHLTLEGSYRAMGRELARIATTELGTDKTTAWADPETVKAQLVWLEEHWPAQYERSLGVAEELGLDLSGDAPPIDPTMLYYYWAGPGCSNVFWPPATSAQRHATLVRNYDFTTGTVYELMGRPSPPEAINATAAPFIIASRPTGDTRGQYAALTLTTYDLLGGATDGINSAGLSVALMATVDVVRGPANTATYTNGLGINEVQMVRWLLETCATAQEARQKLASTPQYTMWVSCHFIIGDVTGDHFLYGRGCRRPLGRRIAPRVPNAARCWPRPRASRPRFPLAWVSTSARARRGPFGTRCTTCKSARSRWTSTSARAKTAPSGALAGWASASESLPPPRGS